jgi:hypothetical protein
MPDGQFCLNLYAQADSGVTEYIGGTNVIITWDKEVLGLISLATGPGAGYPWHADGFEGNSALDGLNDYLDDGDALYSSFSIFTSGAPAPPAPDALLVQKFCWAIVGSPPPGAVSDITIVAEAGEYSQTLVMEFGTLIDILDDIGLPYTYADCDGDLVPDVCDTLPGIDCPDDVSIDCAESTDPSHTGAAVCTGDCTGWSVSYSDVVSQPDPDCASRIITRTWSVMDSCEHSLSCIQTITITDNTAPSIICPADVTVGCLDSTDPSATGMATCSDDCSGCSVSYSDSVSQPDPECANRTITRTWTAADGCGHTSSCEQTISVEDVTPPELACPDVVSPIECPATPVFGDATATDLCDPNPVILYEDETVAGACPQEYCVTRTWTATDACGNSTSCSRTICVQDTTAPEITCPDVPSPIECPATPVFGDATAIDACDPSPVITFVDSTEPGACPQEYCVTRTWTATDACGNSTSCSRTICVQDTTAPEITCPDVPSPIECPATPVFGDATAIDACDPSPVITFVDSTEPGACPQEYCVTRTWTATDACGNSTSCSRTICVQDTTAPEITCPDVPSPIECPATPVFGDATAIDACDPSPVITFVDSTEPGACPQEYCVTRTWTATDACGNSTSCSRTICVQDTTAPEITCPDVPSPIECPATPVFGDATAIDACDPSPVITFVDSTEPGACPQEYCVTRTWTATDACGNSTSCSRTICVQDGTAPVIECPPETTAPCFAQLPAPAANLAEFEALGGSAVDVCGTVAVAWVEDVPGDGFVTRSYEALDACGNASQCDQLIVIAPGAPVADAGDDVSLCVSDEVVILGGSPTASGGQSPYTYEWTGSGAAYLSSTTEANPTFDISAAGLGTFEVCVTITDANDCVSETDCATLTVNANPLCTITADDAVCAASAGHVASVPDAGMDAAYEWTITGGTIDSGAGTYSITYTAGAAGTLTLEVTITDTNGCTCSGAIEVTVYEQPSPVITATPTPPVCEGTEVTLDAGEGYATYVWSTGAHTRMIVVDEPGIYSVTVTDDSGCVGTAQIEVTVYETSEIDVVVELADVYNSVWRCIHFVLDECAATTDVELHFVDHDENPATSVRATATIAVPCGDWSMLCAKDQQHTLWDTTDLTGSGQYYEAADVLSLEGGDTDNSGSVDIDDVTWFLVQVGHLANPGDCPLEFVGSPPLPDPRDADFSNNGSVLGEDYIYLSANWLLSTSCGCSSPMSWPGLSEGLLGSAILRVELTVDEVPPEVAAAADLNGDGLINFADVREFEDSYDLPNTLSERMRLSTVRAAPVQIEKRRRP